jgi:UPF0716 protein FxsA
MWFLRIWGLFFVVPLIELGLLIILAHYIGWPLTIAITLVSSVVGAELARRSGRQWWSEVRGMFRGGQFDASRLSEGVLILLAAALVLTPGPMTGVFGLLLLIPRVRKAVLSALWRYLTRRWLL